MSEKRFVCIDVGYGDDWYITDNGKRLSEMEIVDCLNEQQEHITHLEDTNDNFRIKLIEDIEAMEQAEKKIGEQQATISALKEENEQLRRLFEEMKQPITINLTEEDEKELRKLLGLIDDE